MLLENKIQSEQQKNWIFLGLAAISTIFCMYKPIILVEGFQFDLRNVAILMGGLYGGAPAIILLSLFTIVIRFMIGGTGAYSTIIISIFFIIITLFTHKKFHHVSLKGKLLIGNFFALLYTLIVLVVVDILFNLSFILNNFITILSYEMISFTVLIYLKEYVHEASLVKNRVLQAEKMEIVSQLASSISHEVRNPLTVVRGFLQLMLNIDLEKEKQNEYLQLSISEIDRANRIIGDYLSFAKPNINDHDILNMKNEISRVKEIITPLANMNTVHIQTEIQNGYIMGTSQLFQQCLLNITKNCIEAMPNGGILTIRAKGQGENIKLEIEDTGAGMTKEQLNKLGEPFFSTKGDKGTGLGMMATKQIIEKMNGKLIVTSELHKGTKFTITFPSVSPMLEKMNKSS